MLSMKFGQLIKVVEVGAGTLRQLITSTMNGDNA